MSKILVTGAAGFVGSHLVEYLLKSGTRAENLKLLVAPWDDFRRLPIKSEILVGDVRDKQFVHIAVKDVDVIYHLAAKTIVPASNSGFYDDTNLIGTKNILEAVRGKTIKKFIFFSSISVFGLPAWKGDMEGVNESWLKDPSEPYGSSKLKAEKILQKLGNKWKIPYIILRPTTVYGPRDKAGIYQLMLAISKGLFVFIGDGKNKMDYVYVKDLVKAAVDAEKSKIENEDFIIGATTVHTQNEIVSTIAKCLDKKIPNIYIPKTIALPISKIVQICSRVLRIRALFFPDRVRVLTSNCYFDVSKAQEILHYKPDYSLDLGIRMTAKWFMEEKNRDKAF